MTIGFFWVIISGFWGKYLSYKYLQEPPLTYTCCEPPRKCRSTDDARLRRFLALLRPRGLAADVQESAESCSR